MAASTEKEGKMTLQEESHWQTFVRLRKPVLVVLSGNALAQLVLLIVAPGSTSEARLADVCAVAMFVGFLLVSTWLLNVGDVLYLFAAVWLLSVLLLRYSSETLRIWMISFMPLMACAFIAYGLNRLFRLSLRQFFGNRR